VQLEDEGKGSVGPNTIPIFVDLTVTPWSLIPDEARKERDWISWWNPSLSISIEFRRKLPLVDGPYASHTFGIFSQKRHLESGRWNDSVEVWSAPCDIGEKTTAEIDEKWREKMVCVAVGSQVALMVPPEMNVRHISKGDGKSKL